MSTPRSIWKFPLEITDQQNVEMPVFSEILSVQIQDGVLCLWAIVTPGDPMEKRRICIVGTGNRMPEGDLVFIATVQAGPFVWHVFEAS